MGQPRRAKEPNAAIPNAQAPRTGGADGESNNTPAYDKSNRRRSYLSEKNSEIDLAAWRAGTDDGVSRCLDVTDRRCGWIANM
jgi:hypothetical protein